MQDFNSEFFIADRPVGKKHPCLIIAEAGVSHFGDMGLARELVDLAAESKADVFKTQIFEIDNFISSTCPDWRERLKDRNLTFDQALELKERCSERGIIFMATAHDNSRIPWLRELNVAAVKVGSGERNNLDFIGELIELNIPIIISTGMYSQEDISELLNFCYSADCRNVGLLHCVTSYPTPLEQVNIRAIDKIKETFSGPIGYSDHTENGLAVLAAVARGANIIERHITILKDVPNAQDWKVSSGPDDFESFVKSIREIEKVLGEKKKEISECEKGSEKWALKSLVAACDIATGTEISRKHINIKRPGDGIRANQINSLIGRRLLRAIKIDDMFTFEDFE
jgi:N,N'-diacetyllegionaminate synthase